MAIPAGGRDETGRAEGGTVAPSPLRRLGDRFGEALEHGGRAWERGADRVRRGRAGRWWTGTTAPGAVDWLLLGAIAAVAFVTFLYGDVRATFEHSFNFMDALLAGRPQDFYQIAIENSTFGHPAVYDIPIYLIFGLWNLPSYVAYRVADYDYLSSLPAQLWLKAMMVVFALVAARLVMEIAKTLGVSAPRAKWAAFYFLSSMTLVVPVLIIVQYDIVSVAVMLAGILAYLKGRTRGFLLWFLLANTLKLFSVFIFIPLVLLREKRVPRAIAQVVAGLLGLLLCRLLYHGNLAYEISTSGFTSSMLERLVASGFAWHSGLSISIFVVFIVCLVVFAYARRTSSDREIGALAVYLSLAAFLVFCAFVPLNPYWMVLVAPFTALAVFLNPRHLTLNSMLELGLGSSLVLIYSMVGFSMYNADMFRQLLFGRLVPPAESQRFETPQEILSALGLVDLVPFLIAFMVACAIALMALNYPTPTFVQNMPNAEPVRRSVVAVRLAAPVAFMTLLFAFYLVPATPTVYSSVTDAPVRGTVSVVAPESVVEEILTFDQSIEVSEIGIGFDAAEVTWINSAVVDVTITDPSGKLLFSTELAANSLGVGVTTFATPGLIFEKGVEYALALTGANDEGEAVFVQLNPSENRFRTTENGEAVGGDLVLTLSGDMLE